MIKWFWNLVQEFFRACWFGKYIFPDVLPLNFCCCYNWFKSISKTQIFLYRSVQKGPNDLKYYSSRKLHFQVFFTQFLKKSWKNPHNSIFLIRCHEGLKSTVISQKCTLPGGLHKMNIECNFFMSYFSSHQQKCNLRITEKIWVKILRLTETFGLADCWDFASLKI